jgi:hypothetical protein
MGCGSWSPSSFSNYVSTSRGISLDEFTTKDFTNKQVFKATKINEDLVPYNVMRECCDSDEHPNSVPVILALDVTGSMGKAAVKVAQKLNDIMTKLYSSNAVKDIEFCIMGIGDLECDSSPIQISQFESDVRIASHMDKIYFEFGGGGNEYESYTAAWYMGAKHCDLDCWKRNKKGIIITMGDEQLNPFLPKRQLSIVTGDNLQDDVLTSSLYKEVTEKFKVYHISVDDYYSSYGGNNYHNDVDSSWNEVLGNHYHIATLNTLGDTITDIIIEATKEDEGITFVDSDANNNSIFGDVPDDSKISW